MSVEVTGIPIMLSKSMRFNCPKDDLLLPVAKEGEKESIPVNETTAAPSARDGGGEAWE